MKSCSWVLAGAALLLISGSALADTEFSSQSSFDAAVAGTTAYSIPAPSGGASSQDLGGSYSIGPAAFSAADITLYNDGGYGPGQTYFGAYPFGLSADLSGVNAVGFNFGSYDGPEAVDVFINGGFVDTLFTGGAPGSSFFGYVSNSAINNVSFAPVTEGESELDVLNFETGSSPAPTPEPSSLALLGSALVGGAATLRKRLART